MTTAACCWLSPVLETKQPDEGPGQSARGAPQRGERWASGCAGRGPKVGMPRATLGAVWRRARGWVRTINGAGQALRCRLVAPRRKRRRIGRLAARARDDVAPCRAARLSSRTARGGGLEHVAALKLDFRRATSRGSGAQSAAGRAPNMSGSIEPSSHTRSATGAASPSGCAAGASTNVSLENVQAKICVSSMAATPRPPFRGAALATRAAVARKREAQVLKASALWANEERKLGRSYGVEQRERRQRRRNLERL